MAHTIRNKQKLLARVRRISGQIASIERALVSEEECKRLMHMIAGCRGAMAGLMVEVVEDHVRNHLVDVRKYPKALARDATEQLVEVLHSYLK